MPLEHVSAEPKVKHPSESIKYGVDFTKVLPIAGETLTGSPTVTSDPSGLTITEAAVNVATFLNDQGGTVAIGKGVQLRIAGGSVGEYTVTISVGTTQSNTRVGVVPLKVRNT